ncbi:MAG: hypothetical protein MUP55_02440, partial [Candidatus Aenigmarchaeota archaeon]|nr:hypothetical protein [Candidatus Aenigmarchaeota archaeon]
RCSEACESLMADAEAIRECTGEIKQRLEDMAEGGDDPELKMTKEQIEDEMKAIKGLEETAKKTLENLNWGEIESLAEEMGSWRDNMQGTNLEMTSKYEAVSDAADTLENAVSDLEGLGGPDWENTNHEELADELEEIADTIENTASDLEGIEFPGMYG